jgi:hypothetical protein
MSEPSTIKHVRAQIKELRNKLKQLPSQGFEQERTKLIGKIRELEKEAGFTYSNKTYVGHYTRETLFQKLKRKFLKFIGK